MGSKRHRVEYVIEQEATKGIECMRHTYFDVKTMNCVRVFT